MKVIYKNEIRYAKRFKDCDVDAIMNSISNYNEWNGDEIFVKPKSLLKEWIYVYDNEVFIIEE